MFSGAQKETSDMKWVNKLQYCDRFLNNAENWLNMDYTTLNHSSYDIRTKIFVVSVTIIQGT